MSNLKRSLLLLVSVFLISSFTHTNMPFQGNKTHYVVVGVYIKDSDAQRFSNWVEEQGEQASSIRYAYPDRRELAYVYVFSSENLAEAQKKMNTMRKRSDFKEAWVFSPSRSINAAKDDESASQMNEVKEEIDSIEIKKDEGNTPDVNDTSSNNPSEEPVKDSSENLTNENIIETETPDSNSEPEKVEESPYKLFLNAFSANDSRPVAASIELVDESRAKLNEVVNANELVTFERKELGNELQLISQAAGYRKSELNVDLNSPQTDSTNTYVRLSNDTIFVDFALRRIRKGEIQVVYNIFFHPDAAVMKSNSKYELNNLLNMLSENGDVKITIHGHTNGNHFGKIIRVNDDKGLFSLTKANKTKLGSAKELSRLRAETIRKYMVEQGISKARMEIKGWGGKRMIYQKDHKLAKRNVRVEIEIPEE